MFVIVPNWNLSFNPKVFKTLVDLKKFADKRNILLSKVTDFKDFRYYSRKYHGLFSEFDSLFVGW